MATLAATVVCDRCGDILFRDTNGTDRVVYAASGVGLLIDPYHGSLYAKDRFMQVQLCDDCFTEFGSCWLSWGIEGEKNAVNPTKVGYILGGPVLRKIDNNGDD